VILSPLALSRGVLSFGDPALFQHVAKKLLTSPPACVRVVVLGGSISLVHAHPSKKRPDAPRNASDAWHQGFMELLRKRYPCAPPGHRLVNLAVAAVASDFWVDRVSEWREGAASSPLASADLVLVETAHNDVGDYRSDTHVNDRDRIVHYTELLIALLLTVPKPPALMYVAVSSRRGWEAREAERADAAPLHALVTTHWGVPHVSVIDALGPFVTPEARRWFDQSFIIDSVHHPTRLGHAIAGRLAAHQLMALLWSVALPPLPGGGAEAVYAPPAKLLRITDDDVRDYAQGRPLRMPATRLATDARFVSTGGAWSVGTDAPGRPLGLLCNVTGSSFSVVVAPSEMRRHVRAGKLRLVLLKAYDRMGVLGVNISAVTPEGSGGEARACLQGVLRRPVASAVIDAQWPLRVSEAATEVLSFDPRSLTDSCLAITITLLEANRPNNKAKLYNLVLL
jgi:hypothetical protein